MAETALELFQRAEQLNSDGEVAAARDLLAQSSEMGHLPATYTLAVSEAAGLGGPLDKETAERRFSEIAMTYPQARMPQCVARASGWSGDEDWAGAIALLIGYAKSGDPAALIDVALLCLLRKYENCERDAQALLASALAKNEIFAAALLMRLHATWDERFVLPNEMLKALERTQYLPIGQIERIAKSKTKQPTPPGPQPDLANLETILASSPETWISTPGQDLAPEISAQTWSDAVHPCVCDFVAAYSVPMLTQAEVRDPDSGAPTLHPVRKALNARIASYHQTLAIHALERLMTAGAGLPWRNGERLTVLFYKTGDRYGVHADYFSDGLEEDPYHIEQSGERVATTLLSLHAAERGGATNFPHLEKAWSGTTGDILMFRNVQENGSPNPLSVHEGQVVEAGWKTLASLWIRERDYWG